MWCTATSGRWVANERPFAAESPFYGDAANPLAIANPDLSVLFILAFSGLSIYGVILGGWASNSKFSLLGALRASAQMVSYELALILCILSVILLSGSLDLREIALAQGSIMEWNIWVQPLDREGDRALLVAAKAGELP